MKNYSKLKIKKSFEEFTSILIHNSIVINEKNIKEILDSVIVVFELDDSFDYKDSNISQNELISKYPQLFEDAYMENELEKLINFYHLEQNSIPTNIFDYLKTSKNTIGIIFFINTIIHKLNLQQQNSILNLHKNLIAIIARLANDLIDLKEDIDRKKLEVKQLKSWSFLSKGSIKFLIAILITYKNTIDLLINFSYLLKLVNSNSYKVFLIQDSVYKWMYLEHVSNRNSGRELH